MRRGRLLVCLLLCTSAQYAADADADATANAGPTTARRRLPPKCKPESWSFGASRISGGGGNNNETASEDCLTAREYVDILNAELLGASMSGNALEVMALLEEGAEIDYVAGDWTPLLVAAMNSHAEVVDVLLAADADVDYAGRQGNLTALVAAAQEGSFAVVRSLIRSGADVNKGVPRRTTRALSIASMFCFPAVASLLLSCGAVVDFQEPAAYNQTALIMASSDGCVDVVRVLLSAGANPYIKTANGFTALDMAQHSKHHSVSLLLKDIMAELEEEAKAPAWPSRFNQPSTARSSAVGGGANFDRESEE